MFKKTTMSLALTAAMIGGVAMTQQVFANNGGTTPTQTSMGDYTGDILLYPYYTVDNGFRTLIHIVNTSDTDTTIAKVRLRDYKDSQDVLDFTIILSPNDVFAGTITSDGNGAIVLNKAKDTTCTSPNITSFVPHSTRATGSSGHIEVITLATLNKDDVAVEDDKGNLVYPVLNKIVTKSKHDSSGNNTSADCGVVDAYFAKDGIEALQENLVAYNNDKDLDGVPLDNDPAKKHSIASNLMGHYTILDVDKGIQGGGRPSTIYGALDGDLHSPCDVTGTPSDNNTIICGQYTEHYEFPNLIHVEGVDVTDDDPARPALNVTAFKAVFHNELRGLASTGIRNEWSKNSNATSTVNSEWIVTLPTKYVYNDSYPASTYIGMKTSRDVFATPDPEDGFEVPDKDMWDETTAALFDDIELTNNRLFDKEGCSNYNSFKFDREEQTASSGTSTSGGQADGTVGYCNEVATLTFGDYNGVTHDKTAPIVFRIPTETLNQKFGWGGFGISDTTGKSILLPMIGYSMWNRDFGHPGSNFGHIMDHVKSVDSADAKNQ